MRDVNFNNCNVQVGPVDGNVNQTLGGIKSSAKSSTAGWRNWFLKPFIVGLALSIVTGTWAMLRGCSPERSKLNMGDFASQGAQKVFIIENAFFSRMEGVEPKNQEIDINSTSQLATEELAAWAKRFHEEHKHELSFSFCKQAAEKGYPRAQFNLALMYFWGVGTEKDERLFFKWCRRAADQGLPEALCELGIAYYQSIGTSRNVKRSAQCMERAAELGNAKAQALMGYYCVFGATFGIKADFNAAIKWMTLAANQGYPIAYFQLGWMTYLGIGCSPDYKKAEEWLSKAIESGDAKVAELARDFRKTMNAACWEED